MSTPVDLSEVDAFEVVAIDYDPRLAAYNVLEDISYIIEHKKDITLEQAETLAAAAKVCQQIYGGDDA